MTVSRTHKSSKAFKRKLSVIEPWKITGKRGNKDVIVSFVISLHWAEHNNTFWLVTTLDVQKRRSYTREELVTENACFFLGTCPPPKFEVSSLSHLNLEPKIPGQFQNPRDSKNANICSNPKKKVVSSCL